MKKNPTVCQGCENMTINDGTVIGCKLTEEVEIASLFLHPYETEEAMVPENCQRYLEHVVITQDEPEDHGIIPWTGGP